MNCKNCGSPLKEGALFCGKCGQRLESVPPQEKPVENINIDNNTENINPQPTPPPTPTPKPEPSDKNTITIKKEHLYIAVCAVVVLAVAAILAFSPFGGDKKDDDATLTETVSQNDSEKETSENKKEKEEKETPEPVVNVTEIMNEYISRNLSHDSVTAAVIDNKTGRKFQSTRSGDRYTAWGFYLPIYYTYGRYKSFGDDIANGIMSRDVGLCNTNANKAIDALGGLTSLNRHMSEFFSVSTTYYGRYFADVNATDDNYTNSAEAVEFLNQLNKDGSRHLLTNNINDFGVTAPGGASVYAQMGTENRAVKENLNLFAVVKGTNSDYCITIMSKDGVGINIYGLWQAIHNEMERIGR